MDRLFVLVWLRARLWWNGLRSRSGAADAAAAVIVGVLVATVAIGLAVGMAAIMVFGVGNDNPQLQRTGLLIVSWVLGFLAVIAPVIFGVGPAAVPLDRLAVFPLGRGALFRVSLGASFVRGIHLLWIPSFCAVCGVMSVGRGREAIPAVAVLVVLAACLVIWSHALLLIMQRMLQRRSLRELIVLVAFIVLIAASLTPAILESQGLGPDSARLLVPEALISETTRVAAVFPPSIAAKGLDSVLGGRPAAAIPAAAWLGVWLVVGVGLGYRVLVRSLADGGGSVTKGPSRGKEPGRAAGRQGLFSVDRLTWLSPQVRAVAAKEVAYLLRSTLGKFNVVMMPLFVVVLALVLGRDLTGPVLGVDANSLLFLGAMLYVSMFSNNIIYNAFAWEGAGVQSYILAPADLKSVLFGKNLGLWAINAVFALECLLSFALIVGIPPLGEMINGFLVFSAALLGSTIVGNFVSVAFPVARDPAKFVGSPSQTGVATSFGILVANAVLVGAVVFVPGLLGVNWFRPVLLGALIVLESVIYRASLGLAGQLMARRREGLVEALQIAH